MANPAAGGAMVIDNTVVYVQSLLGRPEVDVAIALAVFGGGSMLAALLLPRILDRLPDRSVMLGCAVISLHPDRDVEAKLNGVDPQAWLADTVARIPDIKIDDLLPWQYRP